MNTSELEKKRKEIRTKDILYTPNCFLSIRGLFDYWTDERKSTARVPRMLLYMEEKSKLRAREYEKVFHQATKQLKNKLSVEEANYNYRSQSTNPEVKARAESNLYIIEELRQGLMLEEEEKNHNIEQVKNHLAVKRAAYLRLVKITDRY